MLVLADSTSSCEQLSLFAQNMSYLWRWDPQLALSLDAIDEDELPPVEPSRTGPPTLRRQAPGGQFLYLHSRYDVQAEAEKWAAHHLEEGKFCYIIEGLGLGYHVKEMYRQLKGDIIFVVIEPDLPTVRQALTHLDWTEELKSKRLCILTVLNKDHIHRRLAAYNPYIMMGTKIVSHPPSARLAAQFFKQMRAILTEYIDYAKVSMVTLVSNAQHTCRNIALNLAAYLSTPPLDMLKSKFSGHPAIVVSAGPSLRKNAHHLGRAKNRAVIIATQTTFKPLLARGVVPDFVCSLDYHEISRQYFEGVEDFCGVHLITEPKAHPRIIDAYCGPVSFLHNNFASLILGERVHGHRDGLRAGASVAHLAFYLAEYLGCDPVILIGQDLALSGHVYYAPGMAIHDAWQVEMNRFCTMEMKEWEQIVRYKKLLRKVQDWNGRELYTEELMLTYLEQFERDFASTHMQVIDATEGGARKRGARPMTLEAALEQFCTRTIPADRWHYRESACWFDHSRLQAGRAELQERLSEMNEIVALYDETETVLQELEGLLEKPKEFNRHIRKIDRLRLRVKEYDRAYNVITSGAQMAEFRKFAADQKLKASGTSGAQRAAKQLERDKELVSSLRADADRMIAIVEEAIVEFDRKIGAEVAS